MFYGNTTGQGEGETELGQRMIGTANRDRTGGSTKKIWGEGSLSSTADRGSQSVQQMSQLLS